jgi:hypothetical protein
MCPTPAVSAAGIAAAIAIGTAVTNITAAGRRGTRCRAVTAAAPAAAFNEK